MANFDTHLTVAAVVSGVVAINLSLSDVVAHHRLLEYFVLGVVGGLLPDIDADNSVAFRGAFNILGVLLSFWLVFSLGSGYSLLELLLVAGACFAAVRYGLCPIFARYTVHRGIIHSIPMGVFCALLTVIVYAHSLGRPIVHSWACGTFVLLGFLVHLTLDEIYSVDLLNRRIKRSFGTALKLGSWNNPWGTATLYAAIVAAFYLAPSPRPFVRHLMSGHYDAWATKLLPRGWGTWLTGGW
ncbi:MAG: metal-dependent hydrolase [Candidatus Competibacterales bacterium]